MIALILAKNLCTNKKACRMQCTTYLSTFVSCTFDHFLNCGFVDRVLLVGIVEKADIVSLDLSDALLLVLTACHLAQSSGSTGHRNSQKKDPG